MKRSHWQLGPLLILFLLLMMGCGQNNALPAAIDVLLTPQPTITPTGHPLLNYSCEHPSPDGRFCGGSQTGWGAKMSDENGRVLYSRWDKWLTFVGWTADSRYAVYNLDGRMRSSYAIMFDTVEWEVVFLGDDSWCKEDVKQGRGACHTTVQALEPDYGFMMQRGRVYDLNNETHVDVFDEIHNSYVSAADWTPDGSKLAYFGGTGRGDDRVLTLFIADANGENSTAVAHLTFPLLEVSVFNLHWVDNQTVQFEDNKGAVYEYILELEK